MNAVSNDEAIAACIQSDTSATFNALTTHNGQRIIMLGDSWTVYYNSLLPKTLQQYTGAQWVRNYGVSGAQLTHMANDQITRALADPAAKHPTTIVIIGGTNNIFNGLQNSTDIITQTEALCTRLKNAWPGVPVHMFPDMARTPNQGYNYMYSEMIVRATNQGISVHPESMWLPMHKDFIFYRTDSNHRENLQHLTQNGYKYLAGIITAALRGSSEYLKPDAVCYADLQYYGENNFPEPYSLNSNDLRITPDSNKRLIFEVGPGFVTLHCYFHQLKYAHDMDSTIPKIRDDQQFAHLMLCTIPERGADNTTYDSNNKYLPFPPTRAVYSTAYAYNSMGIKYQGLLRVYPKTYGTTVIDIAINKGDTTTPWGNFITIAGTIQYPLSLDSV